MLRPVNKVAVKLYDKFLTVFMGVNLRFNFNY